MKWSLFCDLKLFSLIDGNRRRNQANHKTQNMKNNKFLFADKIKTV